MKKKLSPKDIKLILIFGGLVIFLGLYFGVYTAYTDKADAVAKEIAQQKPRLEQLQEYEGNLRRYEKSIDEDRMKLRLLSVNYPNGVRSEDKIMYVVDLEKDVGLEIGAASFSDSAMIAEFPGVITEGNSYEKVSMAGWKSSLSLSCKLSYQELKDSIAYIYGTRYSTALDAVSVSYDSSTGHLIGTMNLSKYFVTGLDDAYHETDAGDIPLGQPNPFRTIGGEGALPVGN